MYFREARTEDLPEIERIYNEIFDHERRTVCYTNWKSGLYPTIEYARNALEVKTLFVGEQEGILYGSVVLNGLQPEEYRNIRWKNEAPPGKVMVIHTLCIRPGRAGRGKGAQMVAFCQEHARRCGMEVIRLDTYEGNLPACALYTRLGYTYAGTCRFHFQQLIWENLKCFEKKL